jgi:hypothetical protein
VGRSAEDDDHTTFLRFEQEGGASDEDLILSRAAFTLHTAGIVNSVRDGHPGFVSDDYLNAITAETSVTAAELCTAGLWKRADGGYEVVDPEMLDMAIKADKEVTKITEDCAGKGGHFADPETPGWCRECGSQMDHTEHDGSGS